MPMNGKDPEKIPESEIKEKNVAVNVVVDVRDNNKGPAENETEITKL